MLTPYQVQVQTEQAALPAATLAAFFEAKRLLAAAGWKISSGSWADSTQVYVFSAEGEGPATYGACCASVTGRMKNGEWIFSEMGGNRSRKPKNWKW